MNINELKKEVTLIFPIEIFLCNGKCLIWNKKSKKKKMNIFHYLKIF